MSTEGLQTAVANGDTRTLTFHHTHSGEDLTVTFKREGRYDENGLAQLNHFLRDWRNQAQTTMDRRLFDVVWEVYQEVGGKAPVQIVSAYRSPATNAMLHRRSHGVAQFSQHMLGKAMDFFIPGVNLENIRFAGLRLERGGVGYYPTSGSPFVHLDVGNVRHWPRMSRQQLARVFPDGRTVHIPSDGRPMSGYAVALADIQRRGSSLPSAMSLASARSVGAVSGELGGKPKRSLLASLFGAREESDEEGGAESGAAAAGNAPRVMPNQSAGMPSQPAARPVQVAAAAPVPLPRTRPTATGRTNPVERAGAPIQVASAGDPMPLARTLAPAPQATAETPAQVVQSRGLWRGADVVAATEAPPAASQPSGRRERMVWQVGPQAVRGTTSAVTRREAAPPRHRRVELASASPETTGSLPQWPGAAPAQPAAGGMMLAYAEPTVDQALSRSVPAPMGSVRPASAVARTAGGVQGDKTARVTAPLGQLVDKPWLRGVMLAPSVYSAMGVAVMGAPNYRELAQLMRKPAAVVAMGFSPDDAVEPAAEGFTGPAVAFIPIVTVEGRVTAGLN